MRREPHSLSPSQPPFHNSQPTTYFPNRHWPSCAFAPAPKSTSARRSGSMHPRPRNPLPTPPPRPPRC
jgi:hypothetical protein